jgi:hypothetical protein
MNKNSDCKRIYRYHAWEEGEETCSRCGKSRVTKTKQGDWEKETKETFERIVFETMADMTEVGVQKWEFDWSKLWNFIRQTREQAKQEGIEEAINWVQVNQKGTFTDEAGHDCWYIDDLVKALKELKKKAKLNKIIGGR